jgi:hypothetical protein
MKRQEAFKIASGVADLGIDCSVSIAAPHLGAGIPETCVVHILSFVDGVQFTRLIELADEHDAEFQLDRRDFRITGRPATRSVAA